MFKTISAIAVVALLSSCGETNRKGNFELKGTLSNSNGETIYLEKLINPQPVTVDSTVIDEKGNFEFKNYTPNIGFYRIKLNQQNVRRNHSARLRQKIPCECQPTIPTA